MDTRTLTRHITSANEDIARLRRLRVSAEGQLAIERAQSELGQALVVIEKLESQLFQLQEQNQQLRRDLAEQVCARLCEKGRPIAS